MGKNFKSIDHVQCGPPPRFPRMCGTSLKTINNIIHKDLELDTRRKGKVHKLTPFHMKNRATNARKLYEEHLAGSRSEYTATLDEAWMYVTYCNGIRKICYIKRGNQVPDNWVHQCSETFPKGFMVVGVMTGRGVLPLIKVPSKVKVNSEFYIECVLKPVIEQLKDLYQGEMDKVFLHHDKASSHTSNKTQQFLQEMKDTLGLNFIRNSDIPVKSPDASPLDFYGFGMLKQRLFNRRPKTEAGLWKAAQEEWSNVSLSKVKEGSSMKGIIVKSNDKRKNKSVQGWESLRKYAGDEDPRQWITSLEEVGFLYRWADYIITRYAAMNLVGPAKTWYEFHKVNLATWEIFKTRLIQDFASLENKDEMMLKLNRMQGWNELAMRFAEDILLQCSKVQPNMEEMEKIQFVIGDGKRLNILGSISMDIKIDEKSLNHRFVVLESNMKSLIIGRDLLRRLNAKINCKQDILEYDIVTECLDSNEAPRKIINQQDEVVPQLCVKLVRVTVKANDGEYVVEPNEKLTLTNGLRIARCLITNQTLGYASPPTMVNNIEDDEEDKVTEIQINEDLTLSQKNELRQVLSKYSDLFSSKLGKTNLAKHRIDTENAKPIKHKPYRVSPKERDIIKEQIQDMLQEGVIRASSGPWAFPVILVRKRDGNWRFCVDYRKLNSITVKDVYPIPRIDDVMDTLQGSRYFTAIDLRSGYWQVEIEEQDKKKTAFTTSHGLYEFNVMPFGLCNAPATFERIMDNVLKNIKWKFCLCYLDDVIIYSPDFTTHLGRIEAVLKCFRESNLRLNGKKCRFGFEEIEILGHVTSKHGIRPADHNVKAIRDFPRPSKTKEIQSFIGLCSYYRKFIKNFSRIADPLFKLTRKDSPFIWSESQEEAFITLKSLLTNPPI
ncbi:K02A2.6-like [Cordylochernes scorpioides]|uniref:K02A2.6-like n=1 Tax=Cordylochernes scorpioides TaxID=51811 RepID=A0ABY6KL13_9ARAC|nr:K02A2.6-like [Cordylochernes scorpioides]